MNKILGIDFGEKKIGIATSDESGALAFPRGIFANDELLDARIGEIIEREEIGEIVLGEALDFNNRRNPVMENIEKFKARLEKTFSLPVIFEQEYLTSSEARRWGPKDKPIDDSSAALILQRYLDKKKYKNK